MISLVAGSKREGGLGREKGAKEGKREGSLALSPQFPFFFPSSLSPTPFDACYAGYLIMRLFSGSSFSCRKV